MTDSQPKSFTSWKLDVWNAISMDAELNPTERIIAWRLLNRASAGGEIYPSQETLAIEAAVSEQTVKLAVAVLVRRGWITRERRNRRDSNHYRFVDQLVEMIRSEVQDCLEERAPRVRKRTFKKQLEGTKPNPLEGTFSDRMTVQQRTPNTYEGTPCSEHPVTTGSEGEAVSLGSVGTDDEPLGAAAPTTLSKPSGGSKPQTVEISDSLRRSPLMQAIPDPTSIFDRIEAEQRRKAGGGR